MNLKEELEYQQALQQHLHKWLLGLIRAGQDEGLKGGALILVWENGSEIVAAMPEGLTLTELIAKLYRATQDGDAVPMKGDQTETHI